MYNTTIKCVRTIDLVCLRWKISINFIDLVCLHIHIQCTEKQEATMKMRKVWKCSMSLNIIECFRRNSLTKFRIISFLTYYSEILHTKMKAATKKKTHTPKYTPSNCWEINWILTSARQKRGYKIILSNFCEQHVGRRCN